MSRVAVKLLCTKEQEMVLNKLARSRTEQIRLVERAKIVLACLSGKRNDQIATEMKLRPNTIGIWRNRFATHGLAGLHDHARSGKPSTYDHPVLRQRILEQLEMPPPAGMSTWDGGSVAVSLGVLPMSYGESYAKKGYNYNGIGLGASAPTRSLPPSLPT